MSATLLYGTAAVDLVVTRLRPFLDHAALGTDQDGTATPDGADPLAELARAATTLRGRLRCIAPYGDLSPADQDFFDTAVGLLAAINLRGPLATLANKGLVKLKEGDEEKTFATLAPGDERRWAAELAEALGNITCIQSARIQIAQTLSVINVSGRSRTRAASGRCSLPAMIACLLPSGWGGDRPSHLITDGSALPTGFI